MVALMSSNSKDQIRRVVKRVKEKSNIPPSVELKAFPSRPEIKREILSRLANLNIEIRAIILDKQNVSDRLKKDENILYNYVSGLLLVPYILKQTRVAIIADKRVTKITSGFDFDRYLRYKIYYENYESSNKVQMEIDLKESHKVGGLQAIDFVCNGIFRRYEKRDSYYYNLIKSKIVEEKDLFFK